MTKTDFHRHYHVTHYFQSHVWNHWYDWWTAQGRDGYPPEIFEAYIQGDEVVIKYGDSKDHVPLREFCVTDVEPYSMLWYSDYYDGPISGLCERDEVYYWFDMHEAEYDNLYHMRTYKIYELTIDEVYKEQYWHQQWEACLANNRLDEWYDEISPLRPERDYTTREHSAIVEECHFTREYRTRTKQ